MKIRSCRVQLAPLDKNLLEDKVAILGTAGTVFGKTLVWQHFEFDGTDICLGNTQAQGVNVLVRDRSSHQQRAIFLQFQFRTRGRFGFENFRDFSRGRMRGIICERSACVLHP